MPMYDFKCESCKDIVELFFEMNDSNRGGLSCENCNGKLFQYFGGPVYISGATYFSDPNFTGKLVTSSDIKAQEKREGLTCISKSDLEIEMKRQNKRKKEKIMNDFVDGYWNKMEALKKKWNS